VAKAKTDPERENRITMEIIVDAYDEYERAMGWYCYLKEQLQFPFSATCVCKRAISPLRVKDEVVVLGMAPEDECEHEIFVNIRWEKDGLAVPLSQLRPFDVDSETMQAVEDRHYWVEKGYRFWEGYEWIDIGCSSVVIRINSFFFVVLRKLLNQ